MARAGALEARADRVARARALAGFFAAGALVSTTVLILPGWESMHTAGILVTVVLAASGSGLLHVGAARFDRWAIHVTTFFGTVLIASVQVLAGGGRPTAMFAMLYIWVILHCSLFFSRVVVGTHLVLTTLLHAAALVWVGEVDAIAPQLVVTLGTQLAAAWIGLVLATRQRWLADTDSLTGLGNRRVVDRALEWALEGSRRTPSNATCVAVIDLDRFKAFNDRNGHAAGDRILVEAAASWREHIRQTDTLARTGGDEFIHVMTSCELVDAERIVRRLIAGTPSEVTCSAGLARWDGTETPQMLLDRADRALYRAKEDGPLSVAPDRDTTSMAGPEAGSPGV